jgi:hypothetical protein
MLRPVLASTLLLALTAASAQDAPKPAPLPPLIGTAPGSTGAPAQPAATPSDAEAPPPVHVVGRPATVNNQAITADDVAVELRLLGPDLQRMDPGARDHLARRAVAEEMLLAGEATRLQVDMPDRDVDDWWERRAGEPPDWDKLAASTGLTVARQRELARRAALADLYVLHKCGLRGDQVQKVPPDPMLERVVTVTPSQLREAFTQNHALFDRPEGITCDLYIAANTAARDAANAALDAGQAPEVVPMTRTIALPDTTRIFGEEVATWLATAKPGEHRVLDDQTLLAVRERVPARPATFADCQEVLHNALLDQLLKEARKHLVDSLREHATYWPQDLFSPTTKPADKPAAPPATTPAPAAPPAPAGPTSP